MRISDWSSDVCSSDLDPGNDRPVLAPVELERLSRSEGQRHECSSAADLLFATILIAPVPCESRNTAIGTVIAKADKIGMKRFDCSLLLARPAPLSPQPGRHPKIGRASCREGGCQSV